MHVINSSEFGSMFDFKKVTSLDNLDSQIRSSKEMIKEIRERDVSPKVLQLLDSLEEALEDLENDDTFNYTRDTVKKMSINPALRKQETSSLFNYLNTEKFIMNDLIKMIKAEITKFKNGNV